jgi:hypothetical protein
MMPGVRGGELPFGIQRRLEPRSHPVEALLHHRQLVGAGDRDP